MKHIRLKHWQVINIGLLVYDILAVNIAYFLALWFRFDCRISMIPDYYMDAFLGFAPIYTIVSLAVFWRVRLYKSIWRFASYVELLRVATASVATFVIQVAGITVLFRRMPISYYFIGAILQFFAVLGIRFSYRFILLAIKARRPKIKRTG